MTKLATNSIYCGYEKQIVLKDISLEIPDKKITSMIGPNGSGKTTLLKTLARILLPDRKSVV